MLPTLVPVFWVTGGRKKTCKKEKKKCTGALDSMLAVPSGASLPLWCSVLQHMQLCHAQLQQEGEVP